MAQPEVGAQSGDRGRHQDKTHQDGRHLMAEGVAFRPLPGEPRNI